MPNARRIAVGSDSRHPISDAIAGWLEAGGFSVIRCGAVDGADTPWPAAAEQVARLVAQGAVEAGVVCCWTGTGVSIAANKVPGVRAALCKDAETAAAARRWNGANVLAIALSDATADAAQAIVESFLGTTGIDPEQAGNIRCIAAMERRYSGAGGEAGSRES
jgi:ribose 5-phosphate isomerase B